MTTTRHGSRGATTYLTAGFVLLVACLLGPTEARAQWTEPDAQGHISNTNVGNVGVGTSAPGFKFEVRGGPARNTIGVTGDGDTFGYAGIRIGAFTTTNIPNNRTSAFVISMRKDTWYGGDGSGPSLIIETGTKGGGFAAPFMITPTNDILLNSGRGAGGPAGYVPPYGNVGIGTHAPTEKLHVPYRVRFGNILVGETRSGAAEPNGESIEAFGDLVLLSQPGSVIRFGSAGVAPRMLLNSSGNLGIGTASPAYRLDVAGSVNASGLCLGGDCKTAWSQVGGTSQWTTSGANIFYSGGNVGIGTSSPAALIDAQRAETGDLMMRLWNSNTASGTATFRIANSSNAGARLQFTDSTAYVATVAADRAGGLRFRTGNAASEAALGDRVTILPDGKVGVATSAPSTRLHVGAEIADDANRAYDPNALMVVNQTPTAASVLNDPKPVLYLGRQGTPAQAYGAMATFSLSRYENAGVGSRTRLDLGLTHDTFNDAGVMTLLSNGKVGVGTQNPLGPLSVGDSSVAGSDGYVVFGKNNGSGHRHFRMGMDTNFNFVIGDFGNGNVAGTWTSPFAINWQAPSNSLHVNAAGNVGFGTTSPASKLHVGGGTPAGGALAGLNVALGGNSYVSASNGTVNTFLGSDTSAYGIVGTFSNHPLGLRANNTLTMTLMPNGNVGVGTTTPGHKFDVAGNVNASGLCLGGDCKTAWSQVGGGTSSQWTTNGANIHFNTGNVGIGTTSPTQKLDVVGAGRFGGAGGGLSVNNTSGWTQMVASRTGSQQAAFIAAPSVAYSVTNPYWAMGLSPDGSAGWSLDTWDGTAMTTRVRVLPGTGLFGIGTTAPAEKLHVAGGGRFDGGHGKVYLGATAAAGARGLEFIQESATVFSIRHHDPNVTWQHLALAPHGGNVGVGTAAANPAYKLDVQGGQVNASGGLCIAGDCKTAWSQVGGGGSTSQWANGVNSTINYTAGAVGIGTASPGERLEVNGLGEVKTRVVGTISAGIQFRETTDAVTWSEWQQLFDRFRLNAHDGTTTKPDVLSILPNGNVGIGKALPTEALDVVGNIKATGSVSATYQDVAEWVPSAQKLQAGTVVVLDAGKNNHVMASATAYDTKVAGVVSAQPGLILGVGGEGKVMVATTGRVRVRVDATRGAIKVGDLLVTSEVEGVAMKSVPVDLGGTPIHRPGTIIGKALEPLEKGVGEILVLLSLQ